MRAPVAALRTPAECASALFAAHDPSEQREVFKVVCLDVRRRALRIETVSVGCLTSALVHPREVFAIALREHAAAIVLSHNHPSGDPEPSVEDVALTRQLVSAGTLAGDRGPGSHRPRRRSVREPEREGAAMRTKFKVVCWPWGRCADHRGRNVAWEHSL